MKRQTLKIVPFLKKVFLPFLHWWNLKNLSTASDLFLKLMAIVALILAADFFLLKPNVQWDVRYLDQIDRSKFVEAYQEEGKEIPEAVADALASFSYSLDHRKQTGILGRNEYRISQQSVPEGQYVFYLFDYLNSRSLSDEEIRFAWSAIEESTRTVGKITISNTGNALASNIQLIPPYPFSLTDPAMQTFDLAPGKSVEIRMDAGHKYDFSLEYLWGDNSGNLPNVVVVWDTSFGVVNKKLFLLLGILSIFIWVSVIAREIWFTKG